MKWGCNALNFGFISAYIVLLMTIAGEHRQSFFDISGHEIHTYLSAQLDESMGDLG